MTRLHKILSVALLGATAALLPLGAGAQALYPSKPIRMIIPLAAGSAVDVAARIVVQKMSASMGQAIVVENLPGAAGMTGADRVAKAAADGYTIGGFNDSIMTMVPALQAKMPWDILRDFAPGRVRVPRAPCNRRTGPSIFSRSCTRSSLKRPCVRRNRRRTRSGYQSP